LAHAFRYFSPWSLGSISVPLMRQNIIHEGSWGWGSSRYGSQDVCIRGKEQSIVIKSCRKWCTYSQRTHLRLTLSYELYIRGLMIQSSLSGLTSACCYSVGSAFNKWEAHLFLIKTHKCWLTKEDKCKKLSK
jgi:hypothetical protein